MLGPALDVQGGISTVEKLLLEHWPDDSNYEIRHLTTLVDGSKILKLIIAIKAIFIYIYNLIIFKPQIIHIHFASRASIYRKAIFIMIAKMLKVKIIGHAHGGAFQVFYDRECSIFKKKFIYYTINLLTSLIAISQQWQTFYSNLFINGVVEMINNPVCLPEHNNGVFKCTTSSFVVLFLGRLCENKGTYDLLKAIDLIKIKIPDAELRLGGDGEIEKVHTVVAELGLKDNVQLLGWIVGEDKEIELVSASLFVLTSYYEGLPLAILEAMSYGLPVISTPVGGIPEAVIDSETGYLVQPGDVEAIAEKILLLHDNKQLRYDMGQKARQLVQEKFEVGYIVNQITALYDRVLEEGDVKNLKSR